jgi:choline dehydrogenase-like flavoprotein
VARVIFDGTRAVGVEYLPSTGGDISTAFAAKEVLVAAGALHTPQVLQLSGVGPRDLLEALNIPIISDLPGVGSNLQDQTTFPFVYTCQWSVQPSNLASTDLFFARGQFRHPKRHHFPHKHHLGK